MDQADAELPSLPVADEQPPPPPHADPEQQQSSKERPAKRGRHDAAASSSSSSFSSKWRARHTRRPLPIERIDPHQELHRLHVLYTELLHHHIPLIQQLASSLHILQPRVDQLEDHGHQIVRSYDTLPHCHADRGTLLHILNYCNYPLRYLLIWMLSGLANMRENIDHITGGREKTGLKSEYQLTLTRFKLISAEILLMPLPFTMAAAAEAKQDDHPSPPDDPAEIPSEDVAESLQQLSLQPLPKTAAASAPKGMNKQFVEHVVMPDGYRPAMQRLLKKIKKIPGVQFASFKNAFSNDLRIGTVTPEALKLSRQQVRVILDAAEKKKTEEESAPRSLETNA